jgi:hypothetical protein
VATVAYHTGTSSVYGNVVARSSFTPEQQAVMDNGGNYAGYAVVNGHFTYVGAGATGQDAYNRVYGAPSTDGGGATGPDGATPTYTDHPAKGSWMDPSTMGAGTTVTNPGSPDATSSPGYQAGATPIGPVASAIATGGSRPVSGSADGTTGGLTQDELNAEVLLNGLLKQWGLESLSGTLLDLIKKGYSPDAVTLLLQDTPEYKARFAGNDGRIKNGLAPLPPAQYLATEASYRQALSSAGIPQSFYDNHADFTNYIANDVSPAEIKTRADQAMQFVNDTDPAYLNAFQQYYGAGRGDIAAYFLDGAKNEALLSKQVTTSQIGAAALQQGLAAPGRTQAEMYADQGVTASQAQAGFQNVASVLPEESQIASRFHQQYGQQDAQDEFLGGMASAQRKRRQLNNDEQALFAGSSGVNPNSLKTGTSGSY